MADEPTLQIAVRVPQSWIPRVEAIVKHLATDHIEVKQATILRSALGLGIETLEAKYGLASPAKPEGTAAKPPAAQKGERTPARKPAKRTK